MGEGEEEVTVGVVEVGEGGEEVTVGEVTVGVGVGAMVVVVTMGGTVVDMTAEVAVVWADETMGEKEGS